MKLDKDGNIKLTDRLNKIFNDLPCCDIFCDISCDHGYIAYAMVNSGKCKKAIFSDISQKCLQKANKLLAPFVSTGKAAGFVSDGFDKIDYCDLALIAGIGGEEICAIIKKAKFLPQKILVQPMKNSCKVRELALEKGYNIVKDYTFYADREFYDLIYLEKNQTAVKQVLTEEQILFGVTNLQILHKDFLAKLSAERKRVEKYLSSKSLSEHSRKQLNQRLERLKKYV